MANSILTATGVTREALRVLHQKCNFIGRIHRDYDDRFANKGAKIGDTLQVRLPNEYEVRVGPTLNVQDTTETYVSLQVANQVGVDMNFSSSDLTLSLDDFSDRIIEPAISKLAAYIEADALSMVKDVPNLVDGDAAALTWKHILQGRQKLNENLAPIDNNRTATICPAHSTALVDALKGLFQDSPSISSQYKEGKMGRSAGFDFFENTLMTAHTTGTAAKTTGYAVNGASEGADGTVTLKTGTATFLKGDVVTFAGCNAVHPESKASLGYLKQFVVTEDYAGGAGDLKIFPAIITSGAKQNASAYPDNSGAVVKVGAGANETLTQSLVFHKDAFAFATADLIMPKGVDFAAREVLDGISMRIVRQYDITNDKFPCRIDVLYGYKSLRPQLAARVHADA